VARGRGERWLGAFASDGGAAMSLLGSLVSRRLIIVA